MGGAFFGTMGVVSESITLHKREREREGEREKNIDKLLDKLLVQYLGSEIVACPAIQVSPTYKANLKQMHEYTIV